jgi:light-regulated signal transduction histidine kinase (bacteriophytochrome)
MTRSVLGSSASAPHLTTTSRPLPHIIHLRQVHERLEATFAHWMQIKDSILATVSHEMRSPLHGIIASVELLNKAPAEAERTELLQNVTHCASVLHLLINNVLLSGSAPRDRDALVPVRLQLGALVTKIEAVAKAFALGKALQLTVRCAEHHREQYVVLTDELALVQVGLNFVSNAVRHASSRVDVALGLEQNGAALTLRVEDDGPGLPAEKRAHLFSGDPRKAGLKVGGSFSFLLGIDFDLLSYISHRATELGLDWAFVSASPLRWAVLPGTSPPRLARDLCSASRFPWARLMTRNRISRLESASKAPAAASW